jgi:hypothetical protein
MPDSEPHDNELFKAYQAAESEFNRISMGTAVWLLNESAMTLLVGLNSPKRVSDELLNGVETALANVRSTLEPVLVRTYRISLSDVATDSQAAKNSGLSEHLMNGIRELVSKIAQIQMFAADVRQLPDVQIADYLAKYSAILEPLEQLQRMAQNEAALKTSAAAVDKEATSTENIVPSLLSLLAEQVEERYGQPLQEVLDGYDASSPPQVGQIVAAVANMQDLLKWASHKNRRNPPLAQYRVQLPSVGNPDDVKRKRGPGNGKGSA